MERGGDGDGLRCRPLFRQKGAFPRESLWAVRRGRAALASRLRIRPILDMSASDKRLHRLVVPLRRQIGNTSEERVMRKQD